MNHNEYNNYFLIFCEKKRIRAKIKKKQKTFFDHFLN